jgi:hypothetical protein
MEEGVHLLGECRMKMEGWRVSFTFLGLSVWLVFICFVLWLY